MFLSDAEMVKMMVGADFRNPAALVEDVPLADGVADVFRYLDVKRIGTRADLSVRERGRMEEAAIAEVMMGSDNNSNTELDKIVNKTTNEINPPGRRTENNDTEELSQGEKKSENGDIGLYGFTVRPLLTNFLGLLHGGALAMSIENAARMHAYGQMQSDASHQQTDSLTQILTHTSADAPNANVATNKRQNIETTTEREEGEQLTLRNADTDANHNLAIPAIVRMEIIYKASMNNQLEITCTDNLAEHSVASCIERGKSLRKTTGEVFNMQTEGKPVLGSSATYTCFWSNT